ncbi:putative multiple sugar ABC transporter permease [Actinacidiphila reveromycinica]|uniref:Putative multiple sugar ABC transporter permease n=1 Tax=Actinacidiphila reveromycinica TaxID=659352 RepID=A0A7U3UWW5_9ACTN|nr:sugar ABC transporter permease [Streptomyces sp. SN-593]BBB00162.1 putative multiple sugar ABC transporter permease [Streptomyces sp. SN-593]
MATSLAPHRSRPPTARNGRRTAPRGARNARLRRRLADNAMAYTFMAAGILCFALFSWYPLVRGIVLSFQQDNLITSPQWVGLTNYRHLFADPLFLTAWKNTAEFTGLALLLGYAVPFAVAVLLNELRHFKAYFRVAVYLPVMLPPIVSVMLWQFFYDPGGGLFNTALRGAGLPTSQWIQSPHTAMISLVLVSTWANMGGATLMYLAALQSIPGELFEAAELDGAGVWARLRHVTIPQMRFIMLVLLLLQIISTMQVFVEPFQLTGFTDPSTITVMTLIYRYAFAVNNDFGLAASMSVLLFVVLGVFAALYLRLTREAD